MAYTILFDLDGTLIDSLPDLVWAVNKLLADLGREPVSKAQVGRWVGDGVAKLVERALEATGGRPAQGPQDPVAAFLAHYRGHAAVDSRPYPGVVETLEALRAKGHKMAVCTNKPADIAVAIFDRLGLSDFFGAVIGGDGPRKPSPEPLSMALDALGRPDKAALMVGDGRNDVLAARAAGLKIVLVAFGYGGEDPNDLGADVVIDDFRALPGIADRLMGYSAAGR